MSRAEVSLGGTEVDPVRFDLWAERVYGNERVVDLAGAGIGAKLLDHGLRSLVAPSPNQ